MANTTKSLKKKSGSGLGQYGIMIMLVVSRFIIRIVDAVKKK